MEACYNGAMPIGIYQRTEYHLQRLRDRAKSPNFGMKGKRHSEESRIRMSIANFGVKYPDRKSPSPFSAEHRYNLTMSAMGNKHCVGRIPWNKGMGSQRVPSTYYKRSNANGTHTQEEWEKLKERYGYRCSLCGVKDSESKLAEDHIMPLSKGGSDFIDNIQPLCKSCNSKKRDKIFLVTRPPIGYYALK